jgi:hypothetical protein
LGTQDTGGRQTKQKPQHELDLKWDLFIGYSRHFKRRCVYRKSVVRPLLWMKFIYSYTDLKWDLFIGYSHEKISCKPSVVSHDCLFIATHKINKHTHTDQLISVNALGLAHTTIQFCAIKFAQKYYQP